jgi:deazaflavin-dependent oxidoreductase (nitroreductase family)
MRRSGVEGHPRSVGVTHAPGRRRWLWVLVSVLAARLAMIVAFRRQTRVVIDGIRRFNRRVLNPAMLHLAGRRHWYAARLEHVGRRSGRVYRTPVVATPVPGGLAIPLPYGTGVDWLRNLLAAGGGAIETKGERYAVREPRITQLADLTELPAWWRRTSRIYGIRSWLVVTAVPEADVPAPAVAVPATRTADASARPPTSQNA